MQDFLYSLSLAHHAIIVGLSLAAACSLLSTFIVLRKMALIAEAIAHSGIGGIAVALLLGCYFSTFNDPLMIELVTGVFCVGTAMLIGYISKGRQVSEDSAIGIFLVATLALGVLLLSVRAKLPLLPGQVHPASIEQILFGDLVTVTAPESWIAFGAAVCVFLIVLALYHEFVYTTLDQEMARINGVNTRFINLLMLSMISLIIVVGVRMVGGLMIVALTVLPGATACMLSRKFTSVLILSLVIGIGGVAAALVAALNPPLSSLTSGPILVLTLFLIFIVVWLIRKFVKPRIAADPPALSAELPGHDHIHDSSR